MLRLLCVTAHPDDEAGGFGGSLLLYAERGVETHVLCLTAGTAATHRGAAQSSEELSQLRRSEFARACGVLQVSSSEVLDYPDGKLERLDVWEVCREVTLRVRRIRPHVMMTFGPEGAITGHPDHSMAGMFATLAFQWAARENRYPEQLTDGLRPWRPQKLYFATNLFTMPDRPPLAPPPATVTLDVSPFLERKLAAFRAHQTQAPLFDFFERVMQRLGRQESFHLAATAVPQELGPESDLFDGVLDE